MKNRNHVKINESSGKMKRLIELIMWNEMNCGKKKKSIKEKKISTATV